MPGSSVQAIHVLRVEPVRASERLGQAVFRRRNKQVMNVIGHQAIRKNRDAMPKALAGEDSEIGSAVVIDEENILPIVASLGDVMNQAGDDDASDARHGEMMAKASGMSR